MERPEELIGRQVGPCRIEALLGAGGMGLVFKARHIALDRPVALKLLKPNRHEAAEQDAQFVREARLAAKLEDPRVVQVFDVGQDGPWRYIVMQLLRGETLEAKVRRSGALKPAPALALMREVLKGLSAAHRQGVIHRDVKPSNIMVEEGGGIKLMDFGIASAAGQKGRPEPGSSAGSIDYMAPEQAFDSAPDPRMDLYALGATFFFALTGKPPYLGADASQVLMKHREAAVPDPRVSNREITPPLAALLARLMQKFPDARPATADEVLKLLDAPGLVVSLDPTGSPFRILPPAPLVREGFSAELPGRGPVAEEPSPEEVPLPPPPPAVERADRVTWAGLAAVASLFALFFLTPWGRAASGDWLAGGWMSVLLVGALFRSRVGPAAGWAAALALTAAAAGSFAAYALRGSASSPSIEVLVVAGVGLAAAIGGLVAGLPPGSGEPAFGAGLLLAAAGAWCAAAVLWGRPEEGRWGLLAADARVWWSTGGAWRWGGLLALYAYARAVRLSGACFPWEPEPEYPTGKRGSFNR